MGVAFVKNTLAIFDAVNDFRIVIFPLESRIFNAFKLARTEIL